MAELIVEAIKQTFIMVIPATLFSTVIGFFLAIVLIVTDNDGLKPNRIVYNVLDFIINVLRSFPFIILMVAIFPITKFIVGTSIGEVAAIVPLTIASAPFVARIIESSLKEVDKGVIEAARSFGASDTDIIFRVMLKEAIPSIISGITLVIISLIGYSAMAGTIGAGGLGDLAIRYGYQRFDTSVMIVTVVVLIIIVQGLQMIGNYIYKKMTE